MQRRKKVDVYAVCDRSTKMSSSARQELVKSHHEEQNYNAPYISKLPKNINFFEVKKRKSLIFTLELSQKSDFQHSTTKSDNIGHPTIKTGQI